MSLIHRRTFLQSTLAVGAAVSGMTPRAHANDTMHPLSWGWGYDKSIKEAVAPRLPNATINLEVGTNSANYANFFGP
jgi:hypothetical protein